MGAGADGGRGRIVDDASMIVVGIDGSEGAARALAFAAEEATLRRKGLRIVAVWHMPSVVYSGGAMGPSFPFDEFEHSMRAAAERQASEGLAEAPDLVSELVIKEGTRPRCCWTSWRVRTCLCSDLEGWAASVV